MVSSKHVNCNACALTLLDGAGGLFPWRIVQADQSSKCDVILNKLAVLEFVNVRCSKLSIAKAQNSEAFRSHGICLGENVGSGRS